LGRKAEKEPRWLSGNKKKKRWRALKRYRPGIDILNGLKRKNGGVQKIFWDLKQPVGRGKSAQKNFFRG